MPLEHLDLSTLPLSFQHRSALFQLGAMTAYSALIAFAPSSSQQEATHLAPSGRWGASRIGGDFLDLWAQDLETACTCSCSSAPASMVLVLELLVLPLVLLEQALECFHLLCLSFKSFWTFRWTHSARGPRSGSGAGFQLQLVALSLASLLHVARQIQAPTSSIDSMNTMKSHLSSL